MVDCSNNCDICKPTPNITDKKNIITRNLLYEQCKVIHNLAVLLEYDQLIAQIIYYIKTDMITSNSIISHGYLGFPIRILQKYLECNSPATIYTIFGKDRPFLRIFITTKIPFHFQATKSKNSNDDIYVIDFIIVQFILVYLMGSHEDIADVIENITKLMNYINTKFLDITNIFKVTTIVMDTHLRELL